MRLVHKYPDMLPQVQIDTGAIKFLLAVSPSLFTSVLRPFCGSR